MMHTWNAARRGLGFVAVLAAFGLLAGCGVKTGSVSGKVTHKGKAVAGGMVTFLAANNEAVTSMIDPEGKYSLPKVAVGKAKISVRPAATVRMPVGMKMDAKKMGGAPEGGAGAPGTPAPPKVDVPQQYQDTESSGLTYEVKQGTQEHDIKVD